MTAGAVHLPPRGAGMPLASSSAAMARSDVRSRRRSALDRSLGYTSCARPGSGSVGRYGPKPCPPPGTPEPACGQVPLLTTPRRLLATSVHLALAHRGYLSGTVRLRTERRETSES